MFLHNYAPVDASAAREHLNRMDPRDGGNAGAHPEPGGGAIAMTAAPRGDLLGVFPSRNIPKDTDTPPHFEEMADA